ncbi:protein phosphatase regulator [Lithohypha guttulata]|uniref:uncharacterized protein n=1 Tax=Lithohypha guttulata TaxID=1690604 RepID=UPI002DE08A9A|nr:protein phosphatase regulator [Lithohypha guttulata]KAK5097952.1 protein phosphatase regulator [Lithohypha guttulata]
MPISATSSAPCGSGLDLDPLPHPITHIRLLEVLPLVNSTDAAIRCRLRCVRLGDYDQCYTALSYTWSHKNVNKVISVNGQEVSIRANLYDFLYALCLDHKNVRERNCQVQIMPNIFAKAKTVLAWLESDVDGFSIDASAMQEFTKFLKSVRHDIDRPQHICHDYQLMTEYCPSASSLSADSTRAWKTMLHLCRHNYWTRLWILLENRYAQNLMYLHGDALWTWADFRAPFLLMWYLLKWKIFNPVQAAELDPSQILNSPAAEIVRSRLFFETTDKLAPNFRYTDVAAESWHLISERKPLPDLLKAHEDRKCMDTLDKVYALVGLSDTTLSVDYGRSDIELFCAVLLDLKVSPELSFVSMLAHQLGVGAFQYRMRRRSLLKGVSPTTPEQSIADLVGFGCRRAYCVKAIQARTEISDIVQARLGVQKLNYYRIRAKQNIEEMQFWDDFPQPDEQEMPRISGHTPGTSMPIVDGFDLSDTSFRPAIFLNLNTSRGRAVFGMASTDYIQSGDLLITSDTMHSGIVVRISGLSRTWLTVIGVVLFARKVTIEAGFPLTKTLLPQGSTIRSTKSTTLSDFCDRTQPTPFTLSSCDGNNHVTLRPDDAQIESLLSGSSGLMSGRQSRASGHHSRTSSNLTSSTKSSTMFVGNEKVVDRRFTSRSEKLERMFEAISLNKKRHTR